jgi:endonuclease-8
MPEGPSIVILKEEASIFKGKKVISAKGNTKADLSLLPGQKVIDFKSWGKQFLICFDQFTIRVHLLMFGSYRINEKKINPPRLALKFSKGSLNFYNCSVKIIEGDINEQYDWSADVMNRKWNPGKARRKLKAQPSLLACDALLDQNIFAGSGNIFKNEVLFRIKVHPLCKIGKLPPKKLTELITETRNYAFDFLKWKKKFVLKKHWLAHTRKICPRCNIPFVKKHLGKTNRRSFFCTNCQVLYD